MKLLGSTKSEMIKDKNGKNVLHLEITEVVLVHCNTIINNYLIQEFCIHLSLINHLFNY